MSTLKKKKKSSPLPAIVVIAVLAGLGWATFRDGGWLEGNQLGAVTGAEVRRGPLRVTVVQRGNLSAKNSAKVVSELEGRNQLLWLIDEGAQVAPGDLVAQLDSSGLEDRIVEQDLSVQNAEAALTKAEQELEIQKSQNESDVARANQQLVNANADLEKYEKGDLPQAEKEIDESIALAEADETKAKGDYEATQRLYDAEFETATRLEEDRIRYERAKIALERARRDRDILRDYTKKKELRVLNAAVEEANRELARVNLQASARMVDSVTSERTSRKRYELEDQELKDLKDQLEKTKLFAPAAGMAVYAREEGGWRGPGDLIAVGNEIRERQEVVTIPQSGGMIVEATLHESVVKKVKTGMPCSITVDSIGPSEQFTGRVTFVALLPDKGSQWSNPNLRVFRTHAEVTEGSPEMRPGMSCQVEILVDEIADTLFVPAQAVFRDGDHRICFLDGEKRVVEIGQTTEKWVEILSGAEEGEVVQLAPPSGWIPDPAPEEEIEGPVPGGAGGEGPMRGGEAQRPGGTEGQHPGGERGGRPGGAEGQRPGGERSGRPGGTDGQRPGGERSGRPGGTGNDENGGQ